MVQHSATLEVHRLGLTLPLALPPLLRCWGRRHEPTAMAGALQEAASAYRLHRGLWARRRPRHGRPHQPAGRGGVTLPRPAAAPAPAAPSRAARHPAESCGGCAPDAVVNPLPPPGPGLGRRQPPPPAQPALAPMGTRSPRRPPPPPPPARRAERRRRLGGRSGRREPPPRRPPCPCRSGAVASGPPARPGAGEGLCAWAAGGGRAPPPPCWRPRPPADAQSSSSCPRCRRCIRPPPSPPHRPPSPKPHV